MRVVPNKGRKSIWLLAIVLGLAVHLPLLWMFFQVTQSDPVEPGEAVQGLQLQLVKKPPTPQGQIVTLPEPEKKEVPEKARYLARHDQKVEREQKSKIRTPGPQTRAKKRVRRRSKVQSRDSSSSAETRMAKPQKSEDMASQRKIDPSEKGDVRAGDRDIQGRRKLVFPTVSRLMDLENIQALSATGGADDALLDVEDEGEQTLLNARRYRFISFFERVKEQVRGHWSPNEVLRTRDSTGKAYCCKDRYTKLKIRITRDGTLINSQVLKSSGLEFLDREARRSFHEAAPFLNPPKELFTEDRDTFEFSFGFLLEFQEGKPLMRWVPPRPL